MLKRSSAKRSYLAFFILLRSVFFSTTSVINSGEVALAQKWICRRRPTCMAIKDACTDAVLFTSCSSIYCTVTKGMGHDSTTNTLREWKWGRIFIRVWTAPQWASNHTFIWMCRTGGGTYHLSLIIRVSLEFSGCKFQTVYLLDWRQFQILTKDGFF